MGGPSCQLLIISQAPRKGKQGGFFSAKSERSSGDGAIEKEKWKGAGRQRGPAGTQSTAKGSFLLKPSVESPTGWACRTQRQEVQGYLQPHGKLQDILGYLRACLFFFLRQGLAM